MFHASIYDHWISSAFESGAISESEWKDGQLQRIHRPLNEPVTWPSRYHANCRSNINPWLLCIGIIDWLIYRYTHDIVLAEGFVDVLSITVDTPAAALDWWLLPCTPLLLGALIALEHCIPHGTPDEDRNTSVRSHRRINKWIMGSCRLLRSLARRSAGSVTYQGSSDSLAKTSLVFALYGG